MMRAISIFRWVTLGWAIVGLLLGRAFLTRPYVAVALLFAAAGLTGYLHVLGRVDPRRLVAWPLLMIEVGLGLVLLIGDGFVFSPERSQSLPWAWPAAGIAAVGVAASRKRRVVGGTEGDGTWIDDYAGLLVAMIVGAVSLFAEVVLLERISGSGQIGVAFSKVGLWLVVGLLVGPLMRRLLRAERLISVARAREDLARELHDGVLQTLAVVQRRSTDMELASLARDQENSLRSYLSDSRLIDAAAEPMARSGSVADLAVSGGLDPGVWSGGLDGVLRRVAAEAERLHRFKAQVVVTPDCPPLAPPVLAAVAGAVTEAMHNAAKHGGAQRVTVFAEPCDEGGGSVGKGAGEEQVFVSVHDNGVGFVVDEVEEGIGLSRSIRSRIAEQGGRVEISSRPGKGTEVKIWVKATDRS